MLTSFAAALGFLAVALGAFGAHALEGRLSAEAGAWWGTASLYLLVHASVAVAISLSGRGGRVVQGGWWVAIGAALFAATLYAMALGAPRWLGAVTPIGGLVMLTGWALIGIGAPRREP